MDERDGGKLEGNSERALCVEIRQNGGVGRDEERVSTMTHEQDSSLVLLQ